LCRRRPHRNRIFRMEGNRVLSRRTLLQSAVGLASLRAAHQDSEPSSEGQFTLSPEDDQFLEELERSNFQFFWEQSDPKTGLTKDRCNVRTPNPNVLAASIAATGFGLTAICIGQKRGYVSYTDARARVVTALEFLWKKMPTHRGFFFHWANVGT